MRHWHDGGVGEIALIDPDGFFQAFNRRRPGIKIFPHLGLGYVAAALERNGDHVRVLDSGVATHQEVQRFLSQPAHLYGISTVSYTFRQALQAARTIKNRYSGTPVLLGGPHVSIDPEGCLADRAVDYALRGEAEETITDFLEVLKRTPNPDPEVLARIPGLVYRERGQVRVNPAPPRLRHLDELPYPAWHLFPMQRYQQHALLTSRGCPMECAFCAVDAIWGKQWVHRDPEHIVAEIRWLEEHWGRKVLHINDDNLTMNPKHAEAFCNALLTSGIRVNWVAQGVRADAVTAELLAKMRQAGCHRVSLGIESADPQVLAAIGKKETPEDMAQAIRLCQAAGIQVLGMFMVGNPGDTEATVERSLQFARETRIDLPAFYMAIPYPKTRLWDHVQTSGSWLNPDYLSFNHMSRDPVFETREFPADARRRAYRKAQKFCRQQFRRYHLRFWWPTRLYLRNQYEIRTELRLYWKLLWLPWRLLGKIFSRREKASA